MVLSSISNPQAWFSSVPGLLSLVEPEDMRAYETGARYGGGRACIVVRPSTAEQVSRVVEICSERGVRLVVQGANTGLVGSSTPDGSAEQVVMSMARLRTPLVLDAGNRSVEVGAGVGLHQLNEVLGEHGFWVPIDLGADPTVGGMVATNTGGTRLIRYGDVRRNVLALDVVLFNPPGKRLRLGRALRKDNTGPDLKQLFIGTSGSFGVVVGATLEVQPRPRQTATALVVPADAAAVEVLLAWVERDLGDHLAAFEGMSRSALEAAIGHVPGLRNPFEPEPLPEFCVLVELESTSSPGPSGESLQDLLNDFLQAHFGTLIVNAVVGDGEALWSLRHAISEGARSLGRIIAFDVSVPRSRIMDFRAQATDLLEQHHPHLRVVDFGHIADGGLHFNVIWPHSEKRSWDQAVVDHLRAQIYSLAVDRFGGSFSAEHGIGPHNAEFYQRYTDEQAKGLARQIKLQLDPSDLCGNVAFGPLDQTLDSMEGHSR